VLYTYRCKICTYNKEKAVTAKLRIAKAAGKQTGNDRIETRTERQRGKGKIRVAPETQTETPGGTKRTKVMPKNETRGRAVHHDQ
jgi:hypothetical protein